MKLILNYCEPADYLQDLQQGKESKHNTYFQKREKGQQEGASLTWIYARILK